MGYEFRILRGLGGKKFFLFKGDLNNQRTRIHNMTLGKSIALSGTYFLHNEKVVTSKISLSSKMSMIL